MNKIFNLSDFFGTDMQRLNAASKALCENSGSTLYIPAGKYTITTPLAKKTQADVMNGVYGNNPEQVMFSPDFKYSEGFLLNNLQNCTIEAYGATFEVDGFMEPVSIKKCSGLTVKGLTIDHLRKPYSKGIVTKTVITDKVTGTGVITARFFGNNAVGKNTPMPRLCFFDVNANRFSLYGEVSIEPLESDGSEYRTFSVKNLFCDMTGNELYAWHSFHSRPAVFIENSSDITFEDVTIHSQPGMGIVAHRDQNLTFERLRVIPSAGEHMSTNTDATHITSCKGKVIFNGCFFDGQGDDSLNIHTYYHNLVKTGKNMCRLILLSPTKTHSQTPDYPDEGDVLEFTDSTTLDVESEYKVISCKRTQNPWVSELILDRELPENCEKYLFSNSTRQPQLIFTNNVCRAHLARGVLIKCKNALVENNSFIDVVGTAVYAAAESWWREGVCTTDSICIRHNRISFCGRTNSIRQFNSAGICVSVSGENPVKPTHKNVVITDNIIDCPHSPHAIYISNTQNLVLERNEVVCAGEPIIVTDVPPAEEP